MAWPLTWVVIAGTFPGAFIVYYLRVLYLPDPGSFKLFVGLVLFLIGGWLIRESCGWAQTDKQRLSELDKKFEDRARRMKEEQRSRAPAGLPPDAVAKTITFTMKTIGYEFWGERFRFGVPAMFLLSFIVGSIGGTYGIGGGAIIAPFCVAVFHLPVSTVADAALFGTFLRRHRCDLLQHPVGRRRDIHITRPGPGSCSGSADSEACMSGHVSKNMSPKNT